MIDDQDRIWAATPALDNGLMSCERGGEWTSIAAPLVSDAQVLELEPAREGALRGVVVGTRADGLFEYWPGVGWRAIELPPGVSTALDLERLGSHLLIATDAGLWARTAGGWRRVEIDAPAGLICSLGAVGARRLDPGWRLRPDWLRGAALSRSTRAAL